MDRYNYQNPILLFMIELDDTDTKLLQLLAQDARISGVEIAKKLDISSSTVTRKINRLEENGIIKGYVPIIDNEKMGNMARAALTIKLTGSVKIDKIMEDLIQNKDICNIYETMGNYDILLTCCSQNEVRIYEIIKQIRSIEGVLFVDFTSIVARRKVLKKVLK
ncbi:MAG: Lrp/AsnC family transcriptional regulator [Thermodesulfobacteriales bacterium]|nr:MAG: Lrp/AsnC family transcriptional regulator [Thermodesulfobacteriales bacterium]